MAKLRHSEEIATIVVRRVSTPRMYKVVLLNDDFTTMEFVVMILQSVFHKSHDEAVRIMLEVHNSGRGVAGLFPKEIAEAKQVMVEQRAAEEKFPLKCILESE